MAVFDVDQITLAGAVPSQEAAERILAFAHDLRLAPATVVDNLTIDADVTVAAGVRVVEFNADRFDDDSFMISPDHSEQLDRIVSVMNEFPNVRVHIVGNSDQHGEEVRNLVISQRRAEAVVEYLVTQGIDWSRLTTEPTGESNPVSLEETPEADSLNGRIEFVFFGLLEVDDNPLDGPSDGDAADPAPPGSTASPTTTTPTDPTAPPRPTTQPPPTTRPPTTRPTTTPPSTDPPPTTKPTTTPPSTDPPSTDPPSTDPPSTDPPPTDPPSTDPPPTDPPSTDPPSTDPLPTDPPSTDPLPTDPPPTDPPPTDPLPIDPLPIDPSLLTIPP